MKEKIDFCKILHTVAWHTSLTWRIYHDQRKMKKKKKKKSMRIMYRKLMKYLCSFLWYFCGRWNFIAINEAPVTQGMLPDSVLDWIFYVKCTNNSARMWLSALCGMINNSASMLLSSFISLQWSDWIYIHVHWCECHRRKLQSAILSMESH